MQYRFMTKDNVKVFPIGFGAMRFPVINDDNSIINEEEALKLLHLAYDNGINYYDTAYTYHGEKSEELLGKFAKSVGRQNILIADKMPVWACEEYGDYEEKFKTQLKRLDTDYIDFYLAHSLSAKTFNQMTELNIYKFFNEKKDAGQIKYAGFSFHASCDTFKEIVNAYDWDFCQIQLNYMDTDYQAGLEGLHYAKERGLSVIVMEPLRGGHLARLPEEAIAMIREHGDMTPAEMGFRWVLDQDVDLILSGMSTEDQVLENIKTAKKYNTIKLDDEEIKAVQKVENFLSSKTQVPCTSCEYCMPCPFGVNINGIFERYNDAHVFNAPEINKKSYQSLIEDSNDQSQCTECGTCEEACPQNIEIINKLQDADQYLRY